MASQEVLIALEKLHLELEKLEPAIKHVETAQLVTETVKAIPQKHLDLLKEVKESDINHKNELKELFSRDFLFITEECRKLLKSTSEIQIQVMYEQKYLTQLRESTKELYQKIEDVHFPERLDKLDANVAGIMAGIQSVQSRLDSIERNISDRLKDLLDYDKETRSGLQFLLEQTRNDFQVGLKKAIKYQRLLSYITWALVLIAIVLIYLVTTK